MRKYFFIFLCVLALLWARRSFLHTLIIQPDGAHGVDTYLLEAETTSNFGLNPNFMILGVPIPGVRRVGVMKFDLSALEGKSIVSATLSLWSANTMPEAGVFTVYRILSGNSAWNQVEATWDYAVSPVLNWAGAGGCALEGVDYAETELGSFSPSGEEPNTELMFDLNPVVFTEMVAGNSGLVMFSSANTLAAFRSAEYINNPAWRPKLVVVYSD